MAMRFEQQDIIDDGLALLGRLRQFNATLDAETVDADIDRMREDLGGNLFVEHDKVDVTIHDLIWNLGAAESIAALEQTCCSLIAKVTMYLLFNTGVSASRLADYSAYEILERT